MNKGQKLVLFGAGKIGRSFIAQVFGRAGYEIVFVDIDAQLLDHLNRAGEYRVIIKGPDKEETIRVTHVRGVHLDDDETVVTELADASIAGVSVGQKGLPAALPLIARSLLLRRQKHGVWPLDIIIAENLRNADQFISAELKRLLPDDYPADAVVGLVETSIGKMVPIMSQSDWQADPLQVFAEPYNSLIVAKHGFKNPIPEVNDLAPKDNIKAWVDRKLFIHNLGHATAAYLGFQHRPGSIFMYEALNDPYVLEATRRTMLQSGDVLMALYPGEFTPAQLIAHIDDLLARFINKALGDTVFRVGCDLYRKLGPEDRLAGPIHAAFKLNMPYDLILNALTTGISFRAKDENGHRLASDETFDKEAEKGVQHVLKNICKLPEDIVSENAER
ncbi:MAG: mannitol-1-phosphate 5-dehydrogenase [Planctomycetes bacterium]|nr:mannitol-1-phosphate 5-dehydrogenase [Planctomycetota bacterium]